MTTSLADTPPEVKPNQGMRQPQLGGVQSRLELTRAIPMCAGRHDSWWRLGEEYGWVCGICHPPAFEEVEWRSPGT